MERNHFLLLTSLSFFAFAFTWMTAVDDVVMVAPVHHGTATSGDGSNRMIPEVNRHKQVSYNTAPVDVTDIDLSVLELSIVDEDYSSSDYVNRSSDEVSLPDKDSGCLVNILIYKKGMSVIGRKQGVYQCEEIGCSFRLSYSDNPKALKGKDIVLLYLRTKWDWKELMNERPPGQIWIFYCRESPLHDHGIVPPTALLRSTYNWTMTYRSDSTLLAAYGVYQPGEPEVASNSTRNWADGKPKLAAWMASNCYISGWQRTKFIKQFSRKYLKIDMFGKCGDLKCPKGDRCDNILSRYKFYFALENSICKEYITEKFWRNALQRGSVPVVFGASKEDYERLAPPNSFIHMSDFRTPEELRDYLMKLDKNDTLYNQYFEWKKHGSMKLNGLGRLFMPKTFCEMAKKFLEIEGKIKVEGVKNEIPNLTKWWKKSCENTANSLLIRKVLK